MKKKFLNILLLAVFVTPTAFSSESAVAEESESSVSYNIGYMSEYWYRGVYQAESSVSFGADLEVGNFYAGTWWADVDKGMEYDIYAGLNFAMGPADMYLGVTGYYYSDNFDDDYEEVNFGIAMGNLSIDAAVGEYKKGVVGNAKDHNYSFTSVAYDLTELTGLPLTYSFGAWGGSKLQGEVHTLSFSKTIEGVDVGLEVAKNSDDITGSASNKDTTFALFTLGYSF
tara:strand:+ start:13392 stop:14072 length:681 start_codon:yes stop_codon:yes gene_type:complete